MKATEIVSELRSFTNQKNLEGMSRFGIDTRNALGINTPTLRAYSAKLKYNHRLALELWATEIHEARILAAYIDKPEEVTKRQMESWVKDFNSWDLCDQCCSNLFDKTKYAYSKAVVWSRREKEFVKRAGFVMMAVLSVHDKAAKDERFIEFFPYILRESTDERNFVRKAVNWALRQIGKRNLALNKEAIELARRIKALNTKSSRWIAADALRELTSDAVQGRLKKKSSQ